MLCYNGFIELNMTQVVTLPVQVRVRSERPKIDTSYTTTARDERWQMITRMESGTMNALHHLRLFASAFFISPSPYTRSSNEQNHITRTPHTCWREDCRISGRRRPDSTNRHTGQGKPAQPVGCHSNGAEIWPAIRRTQRTRRPSRAGSDPP